jgi:hypothetical protein
MQVVDVRHVDGVRKHAPMASLKLDLALQQKSK